MTATPPRRWLRPRTVVIAILAIALIWVAREAWWLVTAEPAPVVDYAAQLQALCESHQPPGRDGWELMVAAATRMQQVNDAIRAETENENDDDERPGGMLSYLDFDGVRADPYDESLFGPELRALSTLRENGGMDLLAEAASCPRAVRPIRSEPPLLLNVLLPELSQFRMLARARITSMRIAAETGDEAERVAAFEEVLAVARIGGSQTFLIDRLVGLAVMNLALRELQQQIAERPLDEATARALLDALDRQAKLPPMSLSYESERASLLDVIQYVFTDDGHGDGRLDLDRYDEIQMSWGMAAAPGGSVLGRVGSVFLAGRAETTALGNEFYDGVVRNTELAPADRIAQGFDENAFHAKLSHRHLLLNGFLPAVSAALRQDDITRAAITATRIMLGIEIFRARHGRVPANLDELAADVFPPPDALPADPTHGGPFGYRVLDDPDADWPYLLYSSGVDRTYDITAAIDDGGDESDYEDAVSPRGRLDDSNMDVLYNRLRSEREE